MQEVGDFGVLWFTVLQCTSSPQSHAFIEIGDQRLIFPLLDLDRDVKRLLLESDEALVRLAASRIRRIDYKTVSIVGFEQTISGTYSEAVHARHFEAKPG